MIWNLEKAAVNTSRRSFIRAGILAAAAAPAIAVWPASLPQIPDQQPQGQGLPEFTGPEANSYWNSIGPLVTEPQKATLILMTDWPVQLENSR
jgi:hypothetical protein